jgi:hypothetical protein
VVCRRDEYKCEGRSAKCVQRSRLCDRQSDCPLGDDETNCSYSSRCATGTVFCAPSTDAISSNASCVLLNEACSSPSRCLLEDSRRNALCSNWTTTSTPESIEVNDDSESISKLKNQIGSNATTISPEVSSNLLLDSTATTPRSTIVHTSTVESTVDTIDANDAEIAASSKSISRVRSKTNSSMTTVDSIGSSDPSEPTSSDEMTTAFTHIEHVSEVPPGPSQGFDFQPFFKPFFNSQQIPLDKFMKSSPKTKENDTSADSTGGAKMDYMKKFDYSNFMGGQSKGGKAEASDVNGDKSKGSGSPFDYSKYMKSSGSGSFDYSKFMGGQSKGGNPEAKGDTSKGSAGSGSPFDYSKYMKSSGSGSFDYSTYMSGKPPKTAKSKSAVKRNFHKADYLKFYEDNSDKNKQKMAGKSQADPTGDSSVDFVPIDHRSEISSNKSEIVPFAADSSTDRTEVITESNAIENGSISSPHNSTDFWSNDASSTEEPIPVLNIKGQVPPNRWPAHSVPSKVPDGKGNKVNVSKIIPNTMLNGYSYTHYGSGVFFINFGTIVNGNSNVMGNGNDVGNGNANGNNDGNTQGDNLHSNTDNRSDEPDKS